MLYSIITHITHTNPIPTQTNTIANTVLNPTNQQLCQTTNSITSGIYVIFLILFTYILIIINVIKRVDFEIGTKAQIFRFTIYK